VLNSEHLLAQEEDMMTKSDIQAKSEMLIRKPAKEVFEAFTDPAITKHFWFTKGSGKLEAGKQIQWTWEMFNVGTTVDVKAIEPNKRILIDWGENNTRNQVEWLFTDRGDGTTLVSITNSNFQGTEDEIVAQALDSKQGFSIVLCGAKAWLEHGINLNLIADHFPDAVVKE
jgi:uncharacterized protein YndB with AHSA1/START domain